MSELSPRQQHILRLIVAEHVDSARPVGSETLVRKYDVGCSSATVRNIFAALEARGYIYHPHTSAGRVPSNRGYRFFVEHLMNAADLPAEEQRRINHQFHQVELDLDQWLQLAAAVLAQTSHTAALVSLPLARQARLRHLQLVPTHDRYALMIVVLSDGLLRRRVIALAAPADDATLSRTASQLTSLFQGQTAGEINHRAGSGELERTVRDALVLLMRQVDRAGLHDLLVDGVTHVLEQPEFSHIDKAKDLIGVLQERAALASLASEALGDDSIHLIIGDENQLQPLRECTVIFTRYGSADGGIGVIGLLGPTRMQYVRAISSLRFVADLMNNLWHQYYL